MRVRKAAWRKVLLWAAIASKGAGGTPVPAAVQRDLWLRVVGDGPEIAGSP